MTWNYDKLWGWHPAVKTGTDRPFKQKAADRMKMILATWIALIVVVGSIIAWMIFNSHLSGQHTFDPFPWILLNLCLSCFAALQCFVLLIANKRGEQIAAEIAKHTFDNTEAVKTLLRENTDLTKQVKENTDLLKKLTHEKPKRRRLRP